MVPTLAGSSSLQPFPREAVAPAGPRQIAPQAARGPVPVTTWRYHAIAGYALIVLTFGVVGGWSMVARLDRAIVSPGVINVESSRKVVQHFEGGMVRQVLVKEGQSVQQGDILLRLESLQSRASV